MPTPLTRSEKLRLAAELLTRKGREFAGGLAEEVARPPTLLGMDVTAPGRAVVDNLAAAGESIAAGVSDGFAPTAPPPVAPPGPAASIAASYPPPALLPPEQSESLPPQAPPPEPPQMGAGMPAEMIDEQQMVSAPVKSSGRAPSRKSAYDDILQRNADALQVKAEQEKQQMSAEADVMEHARMVREIQEREQLAREEAVREKQDELRKADEEVAKRFSDPSLKVNPSQFWESRSDGQKVALGIAAFLGGLTQGQGPNRVLQAIDAAIDRDLSIQTKNIETAKEGLKSQGDSIQRGIAFYRQRGMDQLTAYNMAKANLYESATETIKMMQLRAKGNSSKEQVNANAELLLTDLKMKVEEEKQKAYQFNRTMALKEAEAKMQREVAMAAASAPTPLPELGDVQKNQLEKVQRGLNNLVELKKIIDNPDGDLGKAMKDKLQSMFPGTDASSRGKAANLLRNAAYKDLTESAVQAFERADLEDIGGVGNLQGSKTVDRLIKLAMQAQDDIILANRGKNVEGLFKRPPVEYGKNEGKIR